MVHAFTEAMPGSYIALVVLIAVLSQLIAWYLKVPSILLLLITGFALGQAIEAPTVIGQDVLYAGVSLTVGIILFEGSLSLKVRQLRDLGQSVMRLCSVSVLIAWPLIALSAWIAGVEPRLAVLIGALLVVTGPTVINPIVRQLRPTRRASTLLRWEGIVVDPIGAVLATLVFQAIVAQGESPIMAALTGLATTLLVGFGLGIGMGWLLKVAMQRHLIPDFLQGVLFLAAALGVFVISNAVAHESGLVTVTVLGVYLANVKGLHLHRVVEFKEHLQVLFVGSLFVLLASLVTLDEIRRVAPQAAILIALLVLVVRPVSIYLGLAGSDSEMKERTLLAFMAPRGIVAAAVVSIFAIEMEHQAQNARQSALSSSAEGASNADALGIRADNLEVLAAQAQDLVPLVFLVVVGTVAIYGLGVGRLAERLGLASTSPQGVMFAGSAPWLIEAGEHLAALDVPVKVVSHDFSAIRSARQAGLETYYGHVLSDITTDELDAAGMGHLIAASADDDMNATTARQYSSIFGSAATYQLKRADQENGSEKRTPSESLGGRTAFQPARTFDEMRDLRAEGMRVRRTRLSASFTREDFKRTYGDSAVLLFLVSSEGKVTVATKDTELPDTATHIIALLPERTENSSDRKRAKKKATASAAG